jgi:hypothetical protein
MKTVIAWAGMIPALALLGGPVAAQESCPDPAVLAGDVAAVLAPVRILADDTYEGRLAGSGAERCAGDYIAERFAALGLEPAGDDGFFQDVPLASVLNPHAPGGTGRNVLALLPGSDDVLRDEVVVIGAHYDHLGHGGSTSMAQGEAAIHNGADDNASGVAALLDVAGRLAVDPPARSVLFMAFTGEESGLLGSAHWASQPTRPLDGIRAMLNMDMVGRLEDRPLIVYGTGTAQEWEEILGTAAAAHSLVLTYQPEGYGPSDHTSFYTRDIPVLHFFTNTHADYHRPSDDWEKIDAAGLARVSALVADVARTVADRRTALALVRGAGQPRDPAAAASAGYGAWLGTVPDFTAVEKGVKLGGVTPGSPADAAGLKTGDILVGLGGEEVSDLQAMTNVLRARKPGERIEVVVLRDGAELRTTATLGSRSNRGG